MAEAGARGGRVGVEGAEKRGDEHAALGEVGEGVEVAQRHLAREQRLEGAALGEVLEEVGVQLAGLRYHSSQPWPFPAQLMLGFIGVAKTFDIHMDDGEIADARWFTRDELRAIEPGGPVQLPRVDAVARLMIDGWIRGEV